MLNKMGAALKNNMYTKPMKSIDGAIKGKYRSGQGIIGKGVKGLSDAKASFPEFKAAGKESYRQLREGTGNRAGKSAIASSAIVAKDVLGMSSGATTGAATAVAGGAYGAMSDDTSILGGMAMGGAAGFGAVRGAKAVHKRYGA